MNGIDDKDFDLPRLLEWQAEIENDFARDRHFYQRWKEIVRLMIELKSYDDDDDKSDSPLMRSRTSDDQLELDF